MILKKICSLLLFYFKITSVLDYCFANIMKILLIEDEKDLSDSVLTYLKQEGFVCELAENYVAASEKASVYEYDCIIVDITLPDGNGLDIIREIKEKNLPAGVIIVSAKNSLEDKILGLGIGSDDYITKPFHLSELNARIKSVIRRRNFQGNKEVRFNELRLIPDEIKAFVDKEPVTLTKKEYDLLLYFIANHNRVLTKTSIVEHLWGDDSDSLSSFDFIYTHIKNLRRKLLDKGCKDYIQSVYGMGYKFGNI
jgi:DNA-binding response OmpR family regulator